MANNLKTQLDRVALEKRIEVLDLSDQQEALKLLGQIKAFTARHTADITGLRYENEIMRNALAKIAELDRETPSRAVEMELIASVALYEVEARERRMQ